MSPPWKTVSLIFFLWSPFRLCRPSPLFSRSFSHPRNYCDICAPPPPFLTNWPHLFLSTVSSPTNQASFLVHFVMTRSTPPPLPRVSFTLYYVRSFDPGTGVFGSLSNGLSVFRSLPEQVCFTLFPAYRHYPVASIQIPSPSRAKGEPNRFVTLGSSSKLRNLIPSIHL